jgi:uncharacterized protein (DUF1800 family)
MLRISAFTTAATLWLLASLAGAATLTAQDLHWLNRVTYGYTAESAARLQAVGREAFLAGQLAPQGDALPPAVAAQERELTLLQRPMAQALRERRDLVKARRDESADDAQRKKARKAEREEQARVITETQQRQLLRAVHSQHQLQEQMAWFWFNHFNVFAAKAAVAYTIADYEDRLRPHLMGNFRALLRASVTHPAMLQYLDNRNSSKEKPNENYARELMELHTLGVDGGYSQQDVQELARILTGLGTVPETAEDKRAVISDPQYVRLGDAEFNPRRHDFGKKLFLGRSIEGKGWPEIEEVLDILARHPSTARFIARKLAVYFVSDTPPPALVERLAQRFRDTDGNINALLQMLFASEEFAASLNGKYKSSWQYTVSALRVSGVPLDERNLRLAITSLRAMAQAPYDRATPDGYTLSGRNWASPAQMDLRLETAKTLSERAKVAGAARSEPLLPLLPALDEATRDAVTASNNAQRQLMLFLGSPAFMYR